MRVSLPISTVGRALARLQHAADGVAEAQHEVGRDRRLAHRAADAVGAEVGSAHRGRARSQGGRILAPRSRPAASQTFERVDRGRDIVHAHDARAALHRGQRRGHAGRPGARPTGAAGQRAERGLARPAHQQRPAERQQLALPAQQLEVVLDALAEADARVEHDALGARCRRAAARQRARAGRRPPRRPRRRSAAAAASSPGRRACASGRRRSGGCAATASSAPGAAARACR